MPMSKAILNSTSNNRTTLDTRPRTTPTSLAVSSPPHEDGTTHTTTLHAHNVSTHHRPPRVVIVGGGAGGHLAAISLHHHLLAHGSVGEDDVAVEMLEGAKDVLNKVRRSGGGRCNVTNVHNKDNIREFSANYARGNRVMPSILHQYSPDNIIQLFESQGVKLKVEAHGKIFPVSNTSASITQCLQRLVHACHVKVSTNTRVRHVRLADGDGDGDEDGEHKPGLFVLSVNHGREQQRRVYADYVVVATGSDRLTWEWISKLGHSIVPPVPSLFSFGIKDDLRLHDLAGLSVQDVCITLKLSACDEEQKRNKSRTLTERGPLLITHWGLSGPVVLSLSAYGARELHRVNYKMKCEINWLPFLTPAETLVQLKEHRSKHPRKQIHSHYPHRFNGIPRRLWERLLRHSESTATATAAHRAMVWNEVSDKMLTVFVDSLHRAPFFVSSKGQFKDEFVTAGGVDLKKVKMKTLSSRLVDGLYFVGETLDVDAKTGGYNLQFAWSSGWIAGRAIADAIAQKKHGQVNRQTSSPCPPATTTT